MTATPLMPHDVEKPEFKQIYELMLSETPLHHVGDIDDMKGLAVFLAYNASRAYMTGRVLVNNGGLLVK